MGKSFKSPPPPDPNAVARAQTGSNVGTAIANTWLGNADESGPLGDVKYTVTGTKQVGDGTNTYSVPTFKRTQTLSKGQQKLYDQQLKIGQGLNDLAGGQVKRLNKTLSAPISLDGLPAAPEQFTEDFSDYRSKVENAMLERMNPQLARDYDALESRLVNQGLTRGTQAFDEAMNEHGRKSNDARTQIFLASGNEARAASGEERERRGFNATTRERALQERMLMRNQPINEIAALMNGGEVSMPQFTGYKGGGVAPTPVGQYMYQSAQMAQDQARDKAAANAQMWSTLGNVAGAGIYKWSDARLKTDIKYICTDGEGIEWYTYRYLWSKKHEFGVIAQQVQEIAPHAVYRAPMLYSAPPGEYLFVSYAALGSFLPDVAITPPSYDWRAA